uniref:hypothetical protein n=1 Tax=Campylobacter concisus TaxID=199 RepID=UPI0015E17537
LLSPLESEFASVSDELVDKKAEFSELTRVVSQNEALQEYLSTPEKSPFFLFQQIFKTEAFEKYNDEALKVGEINRQIAEQNLKASKQNGESKEKNEARLNELNSEIAELESRAAELGTKINLYKRLQSDFARRQKILGRSEELD